MINLAEQQQQTLISQQPLPPLQGPPMTDRKQVVCHKKRAACLLSKAKHMEWSKSFHLLIADKTYSRSSSTTLQNVTDVTVDTAHPVVGCYL